VKSPDEFINNTRFQTDDLYLNTIYHYKTKQIKITGNIGFHQIFNNYKASQTSKNQTPFYINPAMNIKWELNKKHRFSSSYSYNTTNQSS